MSRNNGKKGGSVEVLGRARYRTLRNVWRGSPIVGQFL